MARAGRKDRGLLSKPDATGKPLWYVRLYHEGRERRFGSFLNKTQARDFYEKAKQEQKSGRFFPERYQRGGYDLVEDMLSRYLATLPRSGKTPFTIADERYYGAWWAKRLSRKRVNQLTPDVLEQIKGELIEKNHAPQTILHYLKFLRHGLYTTVGKSGVPENPFEKVKLKAIRAGRTRFPVAKRGSTVVCGNWASLCAVGSIGHTDWYAKVRTISLAVDRCRSQASLPHPR